MSGIVSYRVDGYEDILTTSDFGKYTKEFLEDLNLKTGQIIPMSSEEGKIVDNYKCYIVCVLDSEYAKKAEVGAHVYREGNSQDVYIVPMCYGHNNSNEKFDLKGKITLVKRN